MTLHHHRLLSRIIRDALARGKLTPEDAEAMLAHLRNPDPHGAVRTLRVIYAGAAIGAAIGLALWITS